MTARSDSFGGVIQIFALSVGAVAGREAEGKAISFVTREDVQVGVKDFLAGGFAIRQKEVYAFAFQATLAQGHVQTLGDAKYLRALFLDQVANVRRVPVGNYEHVAGIDRMQIHECRTEFILVDHGDFQFT